MTTNTTVDPDLVDMMESVFRTYCGDRAEPNEDAGFDPRLWQKLEDLGLTRLTTPEEHGGSGADWFAAGELIGAAAASAVPVPLVEHDLLACWLLVRAQLGTDDRPTTAFIGDMSSGSWAVPWARHSNRIVALCSDGPTWLVADVASTDVTITKSRNIAGEPRDIVTFDVTAQSWHSVDSATAEIFVLRGALARVLQSCGAMERIVDLSIQHATDRSQFGRSLTKFQAVQSLVTHIAAETALARATADAAVARAEKSGWASSATAFDIAVAKSCAGHAVSTVVRNAHQVHGALGTTHEHLLHRFTKPALAWRSEFGSVAHWDRVLGRESARAGSADLWTTIINGPNSEQG